MIRKQDETKYEKLELFSFWYFLNYGRLFASGAFFSLLIFFLYIYK